MRRHQKSQRDRKGLVFEEPQREQARGGVQLPPRRIAEKTKVLFSDAFYPRQDEAGKVHTPQEGS